MVALGDGEGESGPTTTATQQEHTIGDLTPPPPPPPSVRPVILETAKETYLLSPSVLTAQGRVVRAYDIALVLETEVVVEDQEDQVSVERAAADVEPKVDEEVLSLKTKDGGAPSTTVSNTADGPAELVPLPSPPTQHIDDAAAVETPTPAPPSSSPPSEDQNTDANALHDKPTISSSDKNTTTTMLIDDEMIVTEENIVKPQFAAVQVQVLQRGLSVEMFRFAEDGVYVLEGTSVSAAAASASASANDGMMETEWAILVRNWKWAPRWPSLRERV